MSLPNSVQFRTVEDIVDAYVNNNVPVLGIWHKKQLMFPYEADSIEDGQEFLERLLPRLKDSAAIYSLCVYKKVGEGGIASNTPYSASFNFQLKRQQRGVDEEGYATARSGNGYDNELLSRVEALTLAVNRLQEERAEGEEGEDGLGRIGAILQHPAVMGIINKVITGLMGGNNVQSGNMLNNGNHVGLAGISDDPRLQAALEALGKADPFIVGHLEKLAAVAVKDPKGFGTLLMYLDNL